VSESQKKKRRKKKKRKEKRERVKPWSRLLSLVHNLGRSPNDEAVNQEGNGEDPLANLLGIVRVVGHAGNKGSKPLGECLGANQAVTTVADDRGNHVQDSSWRGGAHRIQ